MLAVLLTFVFMVAVVVGAFWWEGPGAALLAVGVCGLLVVEAHERAGDG